MPVNDFWDFRDYYAAAKSRLPADMTAEIFYDRLLEREGAQVNGDVLTDKFAELAARRRHLSLHKPYCKIHPAMAATLGQIKIDIPYTEMPVPFQTFEIRLPKRDNPFVDTAGPADAIELRAILCVHDYHTAPELQRLANGPFKVHGAKSSLMFWLDFGEMVQHDGGMAHAFEHVHMYPEPGQSIADALNASVARYEVGVGYRTSAEMVRAALALVVATMFFVAEKHQFVAPDIAPRFVERHRKSLARGDAKDLKSIEKQCQKLHHFGYHVGREVELPRPIVVDNDPGDAGTGKSWESRWSHVRTGHMRWQRYGPKLQQRKLIFIAPTFVRPDLPLSPEPTRFVIRDR